MQLRRIIIVCGDQVAVEVAASDISHGRIVYRFCGEGPALKSRHRRKVREARARAVDAALD